MELIIKPTERCNFKCTFCSSTHLTDDKSKQLDQDQIFSFLDRFPKTSTIIVNGGDPLMVKPEYYWRILDFLHTKKLPATLGFTTNLWAFYKNPSLWTPLFKDPKVGITTSFNYGATRKITETRIFTESEFWKVSDLFLNEVGYRPDFISVINDENCDTAIDNVYLAKKMDVVCKLNYSFASGDQKTPFLKGHIYKTYLDVIDQGLAKWEYNATQLLNKKSRLHTTCPISRTCDSNIRCLQPDGDYYSCGSFGDDKLYPIDFEREMKSETIETPLANASEVHHLKNDCLTCPLFSICNGCAKTIHDVKSQNLVERHCHIMKENFERLLPYVQ